MEYREVEELRDSANLGTAGTAGASFLRELRQLRDTAGLGLAELAARAHYPRAVIQAAESGSSLPDLPVLSAYVRGCGGTADEVAAWEDRWRSVTGAKASPLLPAREAGNSDAADAGARIGATSAAADSHDPSAIMAALDRYAESMATAPPVGGPPAGSSSLSPSSPLFGEPAASGAQAGEAVQAADATQAGGTVEPGSTAEGEAKATPARLSGPVPGMRSPSLPSRPTPSVPPMAAPPPMPPAPPMSSAPRNAPGTPNIGSAASSQHHENPGHRLPIGVIVVLVVVVCALLALLAVFA